MEKNTVLSFRGYNINKKELSEEELDTIKNELSVSPYICQDYVNERPKPFKLYQESENKIYLPKYYGIQKFGVPKVIKLHCGHDIFVSFSGSLRPEQQEPVNKYLEAAKDPSRMGGILNVFCGGGKTTMAIYIMCELKKKTIVVCHKDILLQQWKERINQFAPNARIGLIKAKVIDVDDKDVVIASLQSLSMKDYPETLWKQFGFVVIDECYPYNQHIITSVGPMKIGDIYNLWINKNNDLPYVLSFNRVDGIFEWKTVSYAWKKKINDKLIKISFKNHHITCTPNHKQLTLLYGMRKSKYLQVGDKIISYNNDVTTCTTEQITQIEYIHNIDAEDNENVFDIEVKDNHTFVCCSIDGKFGSVTSNCHHTSAEVFSKALRKVNFMYSLGLSATIKRKDGLTKVFLWHLGGVVHKATKRKDTLQVNLYEFYEPNPLYSMELKGYGKDGKLNVSGMINNICNYQPRTQFIVNTLQEILKKEPQRKVFILSDRRQHLKDLHDTFSKVGLSSGFYVGGMKQDDLKKSEAKQIILATYHIASEGFDCPGLDTLILASPKSDVIQCVGRILRTPEKLRVHIPLVIDIVDNFSLFTKQGKKRLAYYKSCGYKVLGKEILEESVSNNISLKGPCFIEEDQ